MPAIETAILTGGWCWPTWALAPASPRSSTGAGAPVVSTDASPCTVRVLRTDEESIIARETWSFLDPGEEP